MQNITIIRFSRPGAAIISPPYHIFVASFAGIDWLRFRHWISVISFRFSDNISCRFCLSAWRQANIDKMAGDCFIHSADLHDAASAARRYL